MNWKKFFSKTILDRGHQYYSEGTVEDIDISDKLITAVVWGSEGYEVEITLSGGEIEDMYCSCPYAADGEYCKHMAAVLYEWSENKNASVTDTNENDILFKPAYTVRSRAVKHTAVERLVAEADENDIRSFLADVLTDNEKLCLRFYNTISRKSSEVDMKGYFRQIDSIVRQYSGRNNFIDYYAADDFIAELEELVDKDIRPMIGNNNYMSAFEILSYIFVVVGNVDIDDSEGGTGMLGNDIYQLWAEIIETAAPDDKRKMFEWFTSHTDGASIDNLEEYIEQIIADAFNEKEFEQDKLDFFKDMINRSEKLDSDWNRKYAAGKWAVRYLDMIMKKNSSDGQTENTLREYRKYSDVRKMYVESCIQKKEYNRAIELLDEGITEDKEYRGLVSDYSRKKKDIYLLAGNKAAYIEQLWTLVLETDVGDMEFYRELKGQYSDTEWSELREKIFEKLPKYTDKAEYYKEEKLYDRLLECVLKSNGLYMLEQYETVLKKNYPEQLLNKYKTELYKMSVISGNRKNYSNMVAIMRRMKKISGGTKIVGQITEEWREKYRNRPAMMDELNKL